MILATAYSYINIIGTNKGTIRWPLTTTTFQILIGHVLLIKVENDFYVVNPI